MGLSGKAKGKAFAVNTDEDDSTTEGESDVEDDPSSRPTSLKSIPHHHHFIYANSPRSPAQGYDAYCVFSGRTLGIFMSWHDVARSISGWNNAKYFGCHTLDAAIKEWNKELRRHPSVAQQACEQLKKCPVQSLTDEMTACALPSTPSTPKRSRATPNRTQHATPVASSSSTPTSSALSDHDDTGFYVVTRGSNPGVYIGSLASWHAAGPDPKAKRVRKDTELEAWKFFGQRVMSRQIQYL